MGAAGRRGAIRSLGGVNFEDGATVTIGGVPAGFAALAGSTTLTAGTGARPAGTVDVLVVNPDGQSAVLESAFTYETPPVPERRRQR